MSETQLSHDISAILQATKDQINALRHSILIHHDELLRPIFQGPQQALLLPGLDEVARRRKAELCFYRRQQLDHLVQSIDKITQDPRFHDENLHAAQHDDEPVVKKWHEDPWGTLQEFWNQLTYHSNTWQQEMGRGNHRHRHPHGDGQQYI